MNLFFDSWNNNDDYSNTINPFNSSFSKLLLFEGFSATLV